MKKPGEYNQVHSLAQQLPVCRGDKPARLYTRLPARWKVAAVNKQVVFSLSQLGLVIPRSLFSRDLGLAWDKKRLFHFSPKGLEDEERVVTDPNPMKAKNLNRYFCPISQQRVGGNYYKCHGNKLGSLHGDSCHCRNSTTQNKNYLSASHYVHPNPTLSSPRWVASDMLSLTTRHRAFWLGSYRAQPHGLSTPRDEYKKKKRTLSLQILSFRNPKSSLRRPSFWVRCLTQG